MNDPVSRGLEPAALLTHANDEQRRVAMSSAEDPSSEPFRMLELEIGERLPQLSLRDPESRREYAHALCLVRLHGRPLGLVEIGSEASDPEEYARTVWSALHLEIQQHLAADGLAPCPPLSAQGIVSSEQPACEGEAKRALASPPMVSVVVPTRNRGRDIAPCLQSLARLDYPDFEIIVVDNAPSNDETRDLVLIELASIPRLRYVREERAGVSRARNRGLWEARGEIVAYTDDDVIADPLWLARLVEGFALGPRVTCVTGLILPARLDSPEQVWIEQYGGFGKGYTRRIFDLDEHRPNNPLYPYTPGIFGSGANMAFRTATLRELGGFDPALGPGTLALAGSELPAFFETIFHGHMIVYEPGAIVFHSHFDTYDALRNQIYRYGVGLTAFITRCVAVHPRLLLDILLRVPYGLYFTLHPASTKNRKKTVRYPRELTLCELRGMAYGPVAYLRSRLALAAS